MLIKKIFRSVVYLLILIYISLSILSYNYHDSSFNTVTTASTTNLCGKIGSYTADILVQLFGLDSIIIIFTISYLFFFRPSQILLKTLYLTSVNLGICVTLSRLKLGIITKYRHGGILGDILIDYYQLIIIALISSISLIGWKRTINFLIAKLLSKSSNKLYDTEKQKEKIKRRKKITKNLLIEVENNDFELPSVNLLSKVQDSSEKKKSNEADGNNTLILLKQVLTDFGIQGQIVNVCYGPVVTLYKLEPQAGTKSARVIGLADDIARSMSALSARISIIRGQNAMGIELPNKEREMVILRDLLESPEYQNANLNLPIALGKDISGKPIVTDLTKMPHLLVAGTTGSGKSVAINTMILSLVYRLDPSECKMIMIDPKMLELSIYDSIPHLITPVVIEPKKAVVALKWIVKEMENRYRMMSYLNVRNVIGYNQKIKEAIEVGKELERVVQVGFDSNTGKPIFEKVPINMETFPYIVVIVDEMADLMLVAGKEIECSIQRLAQMARAAGIHIIMATQRPSVDVITGVIKANFPTRISFAVTSKIDSRTILGEQGAEQLLGMGDMLYMASGGKIIRVHGPFVSDNEVQSVVEHLKEQGAPNYMEEITKEGCFRYINRLWHLIMHLKPININYDNRNITGSSLEYRKRIHKLLHGLTCDLEECRLNCAVAKFREMTNLISEIDAKEYKSIIDEGICILIRVVEPFIPHVAASLWKEIGEQDMQPWPKVDELLIVDQIVTIAVQVNGKLRSTINVATNLPVEELKKLALIALSGKIDQNKIRSIYSVPNKIVNIVI